MCQPVFIKEAVEKDKQSLLSKQGLVNQTKEISEARFFCISHLFDF
ncbi:hypothetical protein STRDD11_02579 [Streptococcus sp. DD11]|nr:hypothetical protein STRDD11_02579 [Streptococcus sp. DD11]